jgi:hypothetical protein
MTFFSKTTAAKKFHQEPKFPNRTFYVGYTSETRDSADGNNCCLLVRDAV